MSVTDLIHFDKEGHPIRYPWLRKFFLSLVIILVATLSFGVGRITGTGKSEGIRVEYDEAINNGNQATTALNAIENSKLKIENSVSGSVVASRNGSKYHYSHCPGAKQIKEVNKISFISAKDAEASGYTLASNCKPR